MSDYWTKEEIQFVWKGIKAILGTIFFTWMAYMFVYPHYHVWSERLTGEAELARAESNRQIRTLEAEAEKDSAKFFAEAEIIRARGVAEANEIIGESLKENESYLRYLWIQGLQGENASVIYVPTEANLPILESQRLRGK